jgi:hypothetical protein
VKDALTVFTAKDDDEVGAQGEELVTDVSIYTLPYGTRTMTAATPMVMPSMVSAARNLLLRRLTNAMRKFSVMQVVAPLDSSDHVRLLMLSFA